MGARSRSKGAEGEREFAREVHRELGIETGRRLGQERDGGCDVRIAHPDLGVSFDVQVKRAQAWRMGEWMAQTLRDCRNGALALLAFRRNRGAWWVATPLTDFCTLTREAMRSGAAVDDAVARLRRGSYTLDPPSQMAGRDLALWRVGYRAGVDAVSAELGRRQRPGGPLPPRVDEPAPDAVEPSG